MKRSYANRQWLYFRKNSSWLPPMGKDTGIKIYNPITKSQVSLITKSSEFIKWYICGPTVYDSSHIGHASAYTRLDIIRRIMANWFNIRPVVVMNITDIDDKIITRSNTMKIDFKELAKKYEVEFFNDMSRLNVIPCDFVCRVSDNIDTIVKFVERLISRGQAYAASDGSIYFDTSSSLNYGKISRMAQSISPSSQSSEKRHPADFALWKSAKPNEPQWQTPWGGSGRPGWHIECSAMASQLFGDHIDLHAGGVDLIFPHHENEEVQSCAYHGVDQWVDYWIHVGHLLVNGMKMSKSLKNFITIEEYLKEHSSDEFRMLCLLTHYRSNIDFSTETLQKAVRLQNKFTNFLQDCRNYQKGLWNKGDVSAPVILKAVEKSRVKIAESLADDFNTSQAIVELENLMKTTNIMLQTEGNCQRGTECPAIARTANFVEYCLQSFGLYENKTFSRTSGTLDSVIDKSIDFRRQVRQTAFNTSSKEDRAELLKACDKFRADLSSVGIVIKDLSTNASNWSYNMIDNKER